MSFRTTFYPQAGIAITLRPPRSGIYYSRVVLYNPTSNNFLVQNGANQDVLSAQQAQLYEVPSSGASVILQELVTPYPYGSYLGPVTAVWYEATESAGSFPSPLGPLAGLYQWTPNLVLTPGPNFYVAPGIVPAYVIVNNQSSFDDSEVFLIGYPSGETLGQGEVPANGFLSIPLSSPPAGDVAYAIESLTGITATISIPF